MARLFTDAPTTPTRLERNYATAVSPSECPASSCSMSSFTLAAMTSFLVCGLSAVGREVTLLVSFVVAMLLMGCFSVFEWPCGVC
jgi:hypothetical protein